MCPRDLGAATARICRVAVTWSGFLSVASLSAQQLAPPQENSAVASVLRVNTRLVQVNVIVNDKHGNPISGLQAKDFSLLDNGKPQEIRVFSAETNFPSNSSHATSATRMWDRFIFR